MATAARTPQERLARLKASPLWGFQPWVGSDGYSPQAAFLEAALAPVRIFRAGNRAGKSAAGVVEALLRCLGWHPHPRLNGRPQRGWLVALDWDWGVGQVLWPEMQRWLPKREVRAVKWFRRGEPSLPEVIRFHGGGQLTFKSADSGARKFQGAGLDFVGVDEEGPGDVIEESRARLITTGGQFWATLTPLRREPWVLDLERQPGTVVVRASMRETMRSGLHGPAAAAAADAYLATLPDRQRRVRELGDHALLEGLVWPEFDRETCTCRTVGDQLVRRDGRVLASWPLPPTWRRYAAMDFGYGHPAAVVVLARSPDGSFAVVERVLYQSGVRITTWAGLLAGLLPPLAAPLVCDHDAGERAELAAAGRATVAARKEVVAGLEAVARWWHQGRLVVRVEDEPRPADLHPVLGRMDGERLRWEVEAYRYPTARRGGMPLRDLPLKVADDACFAAETRVVVRGGTREIAAVRRGFEVLTPCGWQRVLGGGRTRRAAPMVAVTLDREEAVRCTPDHRFLCLGGWWRRAAEAAEGWTVADAGMADAYCLAVPCGAFVLANGLVAKNCDGLRYLVMELEARGRAVPDLAEAFAFGGRRGAQAGRGPSLDTGPRGR